FQMPPKRGTIVGRPPATSKKDAAASSSSITMTTRSATAAKRKRKPEDEIGAQDPVKKERLPDYSTTPTLESKVE
ncbi:hypothetical protein PENTCL1PPCAC_4728, partial [Pristionchus entomophagus]